MWFDVFNLPLITGVVGIGGRPMKLDQDGMERIMGLYQNVTANFIAPSVVE